jgi:hypothetical protein
MGIPKVSKASRLAEVSNASPFAFRKTAQTATVRLRRTVWQLTRIAQLIFNQRFGQPRR